MLEQKNVTVKAGSSFQTVCPFPIGYIYQSYSSTSPANIYGGSWTPITDRFLYCNNNTSTGGSNSHKHLTSIGYDQYKGQASQQFTVFCAMDSGGYPLYGSEVVGGSMNTLNRGQLMQNGLMRVAYTQETNSMPVYQSCYAWRRTN